MADAQRPGSSLGAILRALTMPDRAFGDERLFAVSRFLLFALVFALVSAGSILSMRFHDNDTMRTLTIAEAERRIERMIPAELSGRRQEAVGSATQSLTGRVYRVTRYVGLVLGSGLWLALVVEVWFLSIILMQFLGGEERPVGARKHRRSLCLSLFICIPAALQELTTGIILSFRDPASVENVLTLEQYQEATKVPLSVLSLLGIGKLPGLAEYVLLNLTNPFVLWAMAIALFGGRAVFALGTGKMVIAVCVVFLLLGLQNQLFVLIQGFLGG